MAVAPLELIESLKTMVEISKTPSGLVITIIVSGILIAPIAVSKFMHVVDAFELRGRRRLERLAEDASASSLSDPGTSKVIEDIVVAIRFQHATGIYAESRRRHMLIELHDAVSPDVNWTHIRRASEFIENSKDLTRCIREFTKCDRFFFRYTQLTGAVFLISSFSGLLFAYGERSIQGAIVGLTCFLLFMLTSILVLSQNLPAYSADKIRAALARKKATADTGHS